MAHQRDRLYVANHAVILNGLEGHTPKQKKLQAAFYATSGIGVQTC
jgi:hypothetical protein